MSIPGYQEMMSPVLRCMESGSVLSRNQIRDAIIERFGLTAEDQAELIPSGQVTTLANRVGWAITYLYKSKALNRPSRGSYRITPRGLELLEKYGDDVNNRTLKQFNEFQEFTAKKPEDSGNSPASTRDSGGDNDLTPEEAIQKASLELDNALAEEVLDRVIEMDWLFFEHLVLRLLEAMGYGGRTGEGQHLGGSGDQGVDGVIREDALGLDEIYIQAKHWKETVSRPEMQKFMGALAGKNASKGVFITTSSFTKEATEYASAVSARIILIDGHRLARLMISHGVGVTVSKNYEIKAVDSDFFVGADSE